MDIPILAYALVGMGVYSHHLLSKLAALQEQNESLGEMISSMARELKELGSPNVFIQETTEEH